MVRRKLEEQLVKIVSFLFLFPIFLHAGWFDWLYVSTPPTIQFECPYNCGKWGSESVHKVEWLGIQALYEFDKMGYACRGDPFPYVHLPTNEKDSWYLEDYPSQIEIRMVTSLDSIEGCWRAHYLSNKKPSYKCCCKGFKSIPLQGWEIYQISDEEKDKKGILFHNFFDPNAREREFSYYEGLC